MFPDWSARGVPQQFTRGTFFWDAMPADWSSCGQGELPDGLWSEVRAVNYARQCAKKRYTIMVEQDDQTYAVNWARKGIHNRHILQKNNGYYKMDWSGNGIPREISGAEYREINPYFPRFHTAEMNDERDSCKLDWSGDGLPKELIAIASKPGHPAEFTFPSIDWSVDNMPRLFAKMNAAEAEASREIVSDTLLKVKTKINKMPVEITASIPEREIQNTISAVDWSANGMPGANSKEETIQSKFYDRGLDWSSPGTPAIFHQGKRDVDVTLDWSVPGVPYGMRQCLSEKFLDVPAYESVDWTTRGLPVRDWKSDRFDSLSVDWVPRGLPVLKGMYKRTCGVGKHSFPAVDWSGCGLPKVLNDLQFFGAGNAVTMNTPDVFVPTPGSAQQLRHWGSAVSLRSSLGNRTSGNTSMSSVTDHSFTSSAAGTPVSNASGYTTGSSASALLLETVKEHFDEEHAAVVVAKPKLISTNLSHLAIDESDYHNLVNLHVNMKRCKNAPDSPWNRCKDERREARYLHRVEHTKKTKRHLRYLMEHDSKKYVRIEKERKQKWQDTKRKLAHMEKNIWNTTESYGKVPEELKLDDSGALGMPAKAAGSSDWVLL